MTVTIWRYHKIVFIGSVLDARVFLSELTWEYAEGFMKCGTLMELQALCSMAELALVVPSQANHYIGKSAYDK